MGSRVFPVSWLWSWLALPGGWAAPPGPPTPVQASGTAAGRAHYVSADATKSSRGTAGHDRGKGIGELDAYRPHTNPVTAVTTGPASDIERFDPATSRRIASAASATSDVYANADGSYTRRTYAEPVNYRAADGSWRPIDTGLVVGADKRWHERANSLAVDLAGRADDPGLVSLQVDAGRSVAYRLQGAGGAAASVSGSTATYSGVFPGTDLVLSAVPSGLKESLLLHSADTAASWTFPLALGGLTPRLAADGSVEFVDAAGSAAAVVPPGFMQDASVDPRSGNHAESTAVTYELTTAADGGPALRVNVDGTWLRDPARVFPVTVDPSFYTTGTTFVQNSYAGNHSGMYEMRTGTWDGGADVARSLVQFANFGSSYAGYRISSVYLNLFNIWAYTCTPKPFSVNVVTSGWSPSGTTAWPGPSIGAALGSLTANPGSACTNTGLSPSIGTWMSVPLNASTFNSWTTGGANYGLAVTASLTDSTQWKKFCSAQRTLDTHRLLCAHRHGPYGVTRWTTQLESWLTTAVPRGADDGDWYPGRPLLVTANDYETGLYNGDTGVVVRLGDEIRAAFARGGAPVLIPVGRLANVETVHTMTIHKGQGSQFDRASVILPPAESPLLTRELLYTAITRARSHLRIIGTLEAVRAAAARPITRASGLRSAPHEAR
jgi:large repetitive protein